MPIKMNLADVKAPEPVKQGWYLATVEKVTEGTSQAGNEKVDISWRIDEVKSNGEAAGRVVFDTLTFTPESLPFAKAKLVAMGIDEDFEGEFDSDELLGANCSIFVTIQKSTANNPDTGEPYPDRNRVSKVKPATGAGKLFG